MFQGRIRALGEFREIMKLIKEITEDVLIEIDVAGLKIAATNDINIVQVELTLSSDYFEEFKVDNSVQIGISLPSILKILQIGKPLDSLALGAIRNDNTLKLTIESSYRILEFSLYQKDISYHASSLNSFIYSGRAVLLTSVFHHIINDLSSVYNEASFCFKDSSILIHAQTQESEGNVCLHLDECSCQSDLKKQLNLSFLKRITKGTSISRFVIFELDLDKPARIQYEISAGSLNFYLAPIIEIS